MPRVCRGSMKGHISHFKPKYTHFISAGMFSVDIDLTNSATWSHITFSLFGPFLCFLNVIAFLGSLERQLVGVRPSQRDG